MPVMKLNKRPFSHFNYFVSKEGVLHVLDLRALESKDSMCMSVTNSIEDIINVVSEHKNFNKDWVVLYGTDCLVSKFHPKTGKFDIIDINTKENAELVNRPFYLEMLALYK